MATDVFDERRFESQCSLYEPSHHPVSNEIKRLPTTKSTRTLYETSPTPKIIHHQRLKSLTSASTPTNSATVSSAHNRQSISNDILSLIRSVAMKPFKTSPVLHTVTEGQINDIIYGSHMRDRPSVSLLKYRPLSDSVSDRTSYSQSTRETGDFLRRMGWPINSTTDEARVKWRIAMKFLIPMKFDVNRAINLYRTHEAMRKNESLDRIWIKNPHLIREIQSSKFYPLRQLFNQPLNVYFTAAHFINHASPNLPSPQDRELISLQSLICQLDVATESFEVQSSGLNFIYDMHNCSASQFDMNLSKKVLRFLQGNYPAMVKNIFIVSAPKWFKIAYKVIMYTPEQMRDVLTTHYGYSLNEIPVSLGGSLDPTVDGDVRYQTCLSKVTDPQSICHSYYSLDHRQSIKKPTSNILFFNTDHHHHHNQNQNFETTSTMTTSTISSPSSLVAIVALRRNHDSSSQSRSRKRESSSSTDSEKKRRSSESLIEEEPYVTRPLAYIPQELSEDQPQSKRSSILNEIAFCSLASHERNGDYPAKASMKNDGTSEVDVLKRRNKPTTDSRYKLLDAKEFLSKTPQMIRQEFRYLANPPAANPYAAKEERNVYKSRYRDVLPGDDTRVILQPDDDDNSDFINANYVSGYNDQDKAYIFTQGPLPSTTKDFWRMIWQENISIIVMTTKIREARIEKCFQYWPLNPKETVKYGPYEIQNDKLEKFDSFVVSTLTLRRSNQSENRTIYHAHYLSWPDHGIPSSTKDALLFLQQVEHYRKLTMTKAPILLHCSAGIGRTGTFCAIDIGIKRYLETKTIDIPSTVHKMRTERSGSVQTEDQYLFAYLALKDYIKEHQQYALQDRIDEPNKLLDIDSNDKSEETKVKDGNNSSEIDDNKRKISFLKANRTTSNDSEQMNTFPMANSSKYNNKQESASHRGKALSESSISAVQYVTPTAASTQAEPTREQSITEQTSTTLTTADNVHHKKARK